MTKRPPQVTILVVEGDETERIKFIVTLLLQSSQVESFKMMVLNAFKITKKAKVSFGQRFRMGVEKYGTEAAASVTV